MRTALEVQRSSGEKHMKQERETEIQSYGTVVNRAISLDHKVRLESASRLNQVLADTMMLRDLYKKHHWQVSGPNFYSVHLLFDKHYGEQVEIVDAIAERIQTLGGVAIAMGQDVAELTRVARPPRGREDVAVQLFRLVEAHELIIGEAREAAQSAAVRGDDGTADLLVSSIVRGNELQVWFTSEQLAGAEAARKTEELG
jgi:starvation-inducible DNA-binding protein